MKHIYYCAMLLCIWSPVPCFGQQNQRGEELENARAEKEASLQPEAPGAFERRFLWFEHNRWIRGLLFGADGVGLALGGLAPTSGFAGGLVYRKPNLWANRLNLRTSVRASTRGWYLADLNASLPHLANDYAFFDFNVAHRDYGTVPYYGPGPDSHKTGRSDYRLEDTTVDLRPGVRPVRHLRVGLIGAWYSAHIGPGDSSSYISANKQYSPSAAPGIDRQGSYLRYGMFADYDWRQRGNEPLGGGQYRAEYSVYSDRDLARFTFRRLDIDVAQYVPLLHKKRVLAIHGHSTLTDIRAGQQVPFYLQAVLGGPETLRGFRPFRFYDNNAMWLNAEYRWEASQALDVVVFADAGKVFDRWERLNLHGLESSFGGGVRFKKRNNVAMRVEAGASREGVQLWVRFNNVF